MVDHRINNIHKRIFKFVSTSFICIIILFFYVILEGFFERENYYYSKELFKFTDKGKEFICDFYESGLAYDEYIKKLEQ